MTEHGTPLVSIGLPVFNGEAYVARAIASVLGQTEADLELIVCDNASSDATQEICEGFARQDTRVRYFRNPRNLGAGPNYDLCFARARGTFFKWAAHDDMIAPAFLERAVAALRVNPDAVLCTVGITEIGPDDAVLRRYANRFPGIDAASPARRLGAVIHTRHQCEDFFGLFRRAALIGSGLHGTYAGSDKVLLAEMALRGPWVSVPEPLFLHREHPRRYTRAVLLGDRRQAAAWQDASAQRGPSNFHLVVYGHMLDVVRRNIADPAARAACYAELVRWWTTDGHAADVVRDLLRNSSPFLFRQVSRAKRAMLGTSAQFTHGDLPRLPHEPPPQAPGSPA